VTSRKFRTHSNFKIRFKKMLLMHETTMTCNFHSIRFGFFSNYSIIIRPFFTMAKLLSEESPLKRERERRVILKWLAENVCATILSLYHKHTHTLFLWDTHTLSLSITNTLSLSKTHIHTHTYTLYLFSLFPSLFILCSSPSPLCSESSNCLFSFFSDKCKRC